MPCECLEYQCVEAYINPCSEGVELDIIAEYSGNMTGKVWFNGAVTSFGVTVEDGERIILPTSLFNENYAHEMRLYRDGELIECYRVKTYLDEDAPEFSPTPPASSGLDGDEYDGNDTDTQTFAGLGTHELLTITMASGSYTSDMFTQNGSEVTLLYGQLFNGKVVLEWKI